MIELKDFSLCLPSGEKLLGPINLNILPGEVLIITGQNGSGKSTLLHHLAKQGTAKKLVNVAQNQICFLPQKYGHDFNFPFTLKDALYQPNSTKGASDNYQIIKLLNLDRLWRTASGGERKKTLLARCLLQEPELLLMDEPFNHLDQNSREVFMSDLSNFLALHPQSTLVLITHDDLSQFLMNRKVHFLDLI